MTAVRWGNLTLQAQGVSTFRSSTLINDSLPRCQARKHQLPRPWFLDSPAAATRHDSQLPMQQTSPERH